MDRIEQLMKNAKPQIPGPRQQILPRPDAADPASTGPVSGEAEADSHTFSGTFTDSNSVTSLDHARQSKRRTAIRTGVAGLAAAAVVTLAVVAGNLGSINSPAPGPAASNTASPATPSPSSSAIRTAEAPAPSPTAVASGTSAAPPASSPAAGPVAGTWRTFTSPDGKLAFDYPEGWAVLPVAVAGAGNAVHLRVTDDGGLFVAELDYGNTGGGLGGACEDPRPYTVLDTVEMELPYNADASNVTPRFTYRAVETGAGVNASFGLTSSAAGTDGKSCMFYNVVNGPQASPIYMFADAAQVTSAPSPDRATGVKSFGSLADARAFMQTPGYVNAKRMITSLKITAG